MNDLRLSFHILSMTLNNMWFKFQFQIQRLSHITLEIKILQINLNNNHRKPFIN